MPRAGSASAQQSSTTPPLAPPPARHVGRVPGTPRMTERPISTRWCLEVFPGRQRKQMHSSLRDLNKPAASRDDHQSHRFGLPWQTLRCIPPNRHPPTRHRENTLTSLPTPGDMSPIGAAPVGGSPGDRRTRPGLGQCANRCRLPAIVPDAQLAATAVQHGAGIGHLPNGITCASRTPLDQPAGPHHRCRVPRRPLKGRLGKLTARHTLDNCVSGTLPGRTVFCRLRCLAGVGNPDPRIVRVAQLGSSAGTDPGAG